MMENNKKLDEIIKELKEDPRNNHKVILSLTPKININMLIGAYAMKYYFGGKMGENLTETVRNYREYLTNYFTIVHPSPLNFFWQRKNSWFEEEVVTELKERV